MKAILDSIAKVITEALSAKTLTFAVWVAAILCVFLLLYVNGKMDTFRLGECPPAVLAACPILEGDSDIAGARISVVSSDNITATVSLVASVGLTPSFVISGTSITTLSALGGETPSATASVVISGTQYLMATSAGSEEDDRLGICCFINDNQKWIGLIALTAIIIIIVRIGYLVVAEFRRQILGKDDEPEAEPEK